MRWSMRIVRPVLPPKGKPLRTLSDARAYVLALPKDQQQQTHVQAGVRALLLVASGKACEFVGQAAVATIVHGPPKPLKREKPDRPWMKRKSAQK